MKDLEIRIAAIGEVINGHNNKFEDLERSIQSIVKNVEISRENQAILGEQLKGIENTLRGNRDKGEACDSDVSLNILELSKRMDVLLNTNDTIFSQQKEVLVELKDKIEEPERELSWGKLYKWLPMIPMIIMIILLLVNLWWYRSTSNLITSSEYKRNIEEYISVEKRSHKQEIETLKSRLISSVNKEITTEEKAMVDFMHYYLFNVDTYFEFKKRYSNRHDVLKAIKELERTNANNGFKTAKEKEQHIASIKKE